MTPKNGVGALLLGYVIKNIIAVQSPISAKEIKVFLFFDSIVIKYKSNSQG